MDRVLLMGFLEEMHTFTEADIAEVIKDIAEEFQLPDALDAGAAAPSHAAMTHELAMIERRASAELMDERMVRLEKSIVSVLSILKKIVATPQGLAAQPVDTKE
jgi:hypothetical protein